MSEVKMIELSGLWINESGNGKKYMAGYLGKGRLLMFKNEYKEKDNQPDYKLFLVPKDDKEESEKKDQKDTGQVPDPIDGLPF